MEKKNSQRCVHPSEWQELKKKERLYISDVEKPYSRGADMKLVVVEVRLDDNVSTVKGETNKKIYF